MANPNEAHVKQTQTYYDSADADAFYATIWGGEDIHIGLYQEGDTISAASRRTVETMADLVDGLDADTQLLDLGAGYGGAARYLATTYGCQVTCINLSEVENQKNLDKNQALGLTDKVRVMGGNFESLPFPDGSFDVIWSEDAILHSGNKEQVFAEAYRVLRPGGTMIFTDPMQSDDCPDGVLDPVLTRIHLSEMGSVKRYREIAEAQGWTAFRAWEYPHQLVHHYQRVWDEMQGQYEILSKHVSEAYLQRMSTGLQHWVEAGSNGYLNWGIIKMKKPEA